MNGIEWVSPAAGWLLVLAAPVVALHFYRGRKRTVEVPCLALWERVLATEVAGSGLRALSNLLPLALCLAALVGLAGAAGAPRPAPAAERPPRSWAILLDTSLSMRARDVENGDRWSEAVARVRALLAALPARDRVLLVSCGTAVRAVGPHPPQTERIASFLAGLAPGGVGAPLERALSIARELLPDLDAAEIVLVSDGAGMSGLDAFLRAPRRWFVCVGSRSDHLGLLGAGVDRRWGSRRGLVFARVRNYGKYPRETLVTIRGGDQGDAVLNSRKVAFPAGAEVDVTLEIPPDAGERLVVELGDPDFFAEDRRAWVALQPFRRPRVLVVAHGAPDPFLASTLSALREALDVEGSGTVTPERYEAARGKGSPGDITVFDGTSPSAPPTSGNYLFLGSEGEHVPVRLSGRVEKPVVWKWGGDAAIFRPIAVDALRIGVARVAQPGAEERALIECPQGALALFGDREELHYAWVGFRLADSNFPLLVAFPLFVKGLFGWFAGRREWAFDECYAVGSPIAPRAALPQGVSEVTVVDESDATRRWRVPVTRRSFEFWGADRPGFYRIEAGRTGWRTGVNLASASESDLAPRRDLAKPPPLPAREPEPGEAGRWSLWLACGAAAALLAEWFVSHRSAG
ncbi:MAG: VWA domain-containing protein [Planctomycetes bacterium]|nr:VWA domain-containing protein [Planctomycetota bacterium]